MYINTYTLLCVHIHILGFNSGLDSKESNSDVGTILCFMIREYRVKSLTDHHVKNNMAC